MQTKNVKLVVFVPESHSNEVRDALGKAGAGKIGNYSHCSFSVSGTGRFLPGETANPQIGEIGILETVPEERIEFLCERTRLHEILEALKSAHPYEEIAFDVYPIEDIRV